MERRLFNIVKQYACFFDIELEAKIGTQTHNGFLPGVTEQQFYILKSEMDKSKAWNSTSFTKSTDVMRDSVRNIYENDKIHAIHKVKIDTFDFDYFRISASEEKPCEPFNDSIGSCVSTRKKERWSYFYKMWRYDLTKVIQNNDIKYEVEVELFDIALACQHNTDYLTKSLLHKLKQIKDTIRL